VRITYVPDKSKADGRVPPPSAAPVASVQASSPIVCNFPVSVGDPITATGALASSSNLSTFGLLLGLAKTEAPAGSTVEVLLTGRIENDGWLWGAGDAIFLGDTALSTAVPSTGYLQQVGIADGVNSLIVSIRPPIKL
jgi:hypothetical protein